jgi:hypothetical protein
MYLPIIGILIIISETGWGQSMLSNKRNASVYAVIVLLFSAVHLVHTRNFKDRVASWEFAVASSPSLPMAPQNLGAIYIM